MFLKNRDVFSIHLEDRRLSSSEREQLSAFYQDVFVVYDYIKELFKTNYSLKDFYQDVGNFDLLALGFYVKAIDATKGINDEDKIGQISTKAQSELFQLTGQRGQWYNWLQKDLKNVKAHTFRFKVKKQPPDFIGGYWLR